MRYRKLDTDGDMTFGNSAADFHRNTPECVAQSVSTRLRMWVGQWYLDIEDGTPYIGAVLGHYGRATAEFAIRERILDTEGVRGIISFDTAFSPDDRTLRIEATIDTIFGEAEVNEAL